MATNYLAKLTIARVKNQPLTLELVSYKMMRSANLITLYVSSYIINLYDIIR